MVKQMDLEKRLADLGVDQPRLEAKWILEKTTSSTEIEKILSRRAAYEPLSRILSERDFWTLTFSLSPETLDPRPDSEVVVESALDLMDQSGAYRVLDLGTGTGCLLLSVLSERAAAKGVGIDISADAIETARKNAAFNGLADRADFLQSSWQDFDQGGFDIVLSNPPYIRAREIESLDPEVRLFDPRQALDGGEDGLEAYRQIAARLDYFMAEKGQAVIEIGWDQAKDVTQVLAAQGFRVVSLRQDLGGRDRCLVVKRL